jgi:hypothetical protein
VKEVLGHTLEHLQRPEAEERARAILGQLLLGVVAEKAFEQIYKTTMGTSDLRLEDARESRNDTDYRVLNGHARPVFRINIKLHGTAFRNAQDLVGLDPSDCFALATYKIYQGLQKQDLEVLPYLFVIVSAPGLTGAAVGKAIPTELASLGTILHGGARIPGKRSVEERIVDHLLGDSQPEPFRSELIRVTAGVNSATWRVLSARKADNLLRRLLFERVYAVRVRAFARNYRGAELDMHFSLSDDLTTLQHFLSQLKQLGLHGLMGHLERGTI